MQEYTFLRKNMQKYLFIQIKVHIFATKNQLNFRLMTMNANAWWWRNSRLKQS